MRKVGKVGIVACGREAGSEGERECMHNALLEHRTVPKLMDKFSEIVFPFRNLKILELAVKHIQIAIGDCFKPRFTHLAPLPP